MSTSDQATVRLTQFSSSSGCGCKIAPSKLEEILAGQEPNAVFSQLIVGNESRDDAAVFDLGDGRGLISTADFFMPIVDDAFTFGRIAAANSISDVYAMGGDPCMALALLGWPVDQLSSELAAQVIAGAKSVCKEAGIPLSGGHSVNSKEPFFGLAVNGFVQLDNLKKNNGAKAGDLLFLTKPLGTGILGTALKRGLISAAHQEEAVQIMTMLNKAGASFANIAGVHAMTDVTGFGLLGHLVEMATGANLSASLKISEVPTVAGIESYLGQLCFPDNTYRNWNSYEKLCSTSAQQHFITLCDPQTNGGLLLAVSPGSIRQYLNVAAELGLPPCAFKPIGIFTERNEGLVVVVE